MQKHRRRIGMIGTTSRVIMGIGLLYLALADGGSWGLTWREAGLGLVGFPAVMVALGLAARRFAEVTTGSGLAWPHSDRRGGRLVRLFARSRGETSFEWS